MILPETLSKEPLSPAVRHGDNQWSDIVRWSVFAMINAEELGIGIPRAGSLNALWTDGGLMYSPPMR